MKHFRFAFIVGILVSLLITGNVHADGQFLTGDPSIDGMIADLSLPLESFIAREREDAHVASVAVGLTVNGHMVYSRIFGKDGDGTEISIQQPYIIGSVTKSFTALLILMLADEGKLRLENRVTEYLPGFMLTDKRYKAITVRQLLTHTSGFSTWDGRPPLVDTMGKTKDEFLKKLKSIHLKFSPNDGFAYSNINYILLQQIIEKLSGKPYGEMVQERIFNPLGMTNSYWNQDEAIKNGLVWGGRSFLGTSLKTRLPQPAISLGAAYLMVSIEDMCKYLAFYQKGAPDGSHLISQKLFSEMVSWWNPFGNYGYGWFIEDNGIHHDGDTADFHAQVELRKIRDYRIGVAILVNGNDYLTSAFSYEDSFQFRLKWGILQILGQRKTVTIRNNLCWILDDIRIILFALSIVTVGFSCARLFMKQKWTPGFVIRYLKNIGLVILHLFIPLGILVGLPILADCDWNVLIVFVPDPSWYLGVFAVAELLIGGIRFTKWLVIRRKKEKIRPILRNIRRSRPRSFHLDHEVF